MSHHCSRGRSGMVKRAADLLGTVLPRRPDRFGLGFVMTMILIRMGFYVLRITGCMGWDNGKHVAEWGMDQLRGHKEVIIRAT